MSLTQEELRAQFMHEKGQDDGARDAREADVHGVQINGGRDYRVASIRVEESCIVRQGGHYAHRCGLTGICMLELLESVECKRELQISTRILQIAYAKQRR